MISGGLLTVGGSAGGVEAARDLVAGLPRDLPACVLVTLHIGQHARSRLPEILARAGPLPAEHARDGSPLRPGQILVAPPDRHLLVVDGRAHLSAGPRINRHRPAIDAMFASAARWAGPAAVAAVLSGNLDDGAVGAALVVRSGGRAIVQDPGEAPFPSMPRAVLAVEPDAVCAPARRLGALAAGLLAEAPPAVENGNGRSMTDQVSEGDDLGFRQPPNSRLTQLACPECGGGLAEVDLGGISYFRCHVGHQFSPQGLEAAQRDNAEAKLWAAAAALEEHVVLARHLAGRGPAEQPDEYRHAADASAQMARVLRERLNGQAEPTGP